MHFSQILALATLFESVYPYAHYAQDFPATLEKRKGGKGGGTQGADGGLDPVLIGDLRTKVISSEAQDIASVLLSDNRIKPESFDVKEKPVLDIADCDPSDTCCQWFFISEELSSKFLEADGQCNDLARAAIRLGFHDAGTWSQVEADAGNDFGGADGSLALFFEEGRAENGGLQEITDYARDLYATYNVGMGDLIQYMAVHATVSCPLGPRVRAYVGREDAVQPALNNLLPSVHAPADDLIQLFIDKTITPHMLTALLGAHSTSKQFGVDKAKSGFPQDSTPGVWDVTFYNETVSDIGEDCVFKFPSDVALAAHPQMNNEWMSFIDDQEHWNEDYAAAYLRLSLLGVNNINELKECSYTLPTKKTRVPKKADVCTNPSPSPSLSSSSSIASSTSSAMSSTSSSSSSSVDSTSSSSSSSYVSASTSIPFNSTSSVIYSNTSTPVSSTYSSAYVASSGYSAYSTNSSTGLYPYSTSSTGLHAYSTASSTISSAYPDPTGSGYPSGYHNGSSTGYYAYSSSSSSTSCTSSKTSSTSSTSSSSSCTSSTSSSSTTHASAYPYGHNSTSTKCTKSSSTAGHYPSSVAAYNASAYGYGSSSTSTSCTKSKSTSSSSAVAYPSYSDPAAYTSVPAGYHGHGHHHSGAHGHGGYSAHHYSSAHAGYPTYPAHHYNASTTASAKGYPTVITTSYVDICTKGFTTVTTTYSTTLYPKSSPSAYELPEGWTTTVTVCAHCYATPTTVTLTKPVYGSATPAPAYSREYAPAPAYSSAKAKAEEYPAVAPSVSPYDPPVSEAYATPAASSYDPKATSVVVVYETVMLHPVKSTGKPVAPGTAVSAPYGTGAPAVPHATGAVSYSIGTAAPSSKPTPTTGLPYQFTGAAAPVRAEIVGGVIAAGVAVVAHLL